MNSRYHSTHFINSAHNISQLPPDQGYEVAFAGRSNCGKSSALNTLTHQRSLARTSKTPGRTQMINFFQVEPGRYLVDLPGYGYAKVPKAVRHHWGKILERYLSERQALRGLFLLMDIRHPLTDLDQHMLIWCRHHTVPCHLVLTKADKLKRGAALACLHQVQRNIAGIYQDTSVQLFSAPKRIGLDKAHAKLDEWLGLENINPHIPPQEHK